MTAADAYRINGPDVVHETIEGEVVIINLANGAYYCVSGVGTEIWYWLQQGLGREAILEAARARYEGAADEISGAIEGFLELLEAQELVRREPGPATVAAPGPDGPKRPFEAPVVEVFEDLREILMADPIHDVNESGWPHLRKPEPGS